MTSHPFPYLAAAALIFALTILMTHAKGTHEVSERVYLDLVHYLKYASSAYSLICLHPNGQILVEMFKSLLTEGFVARDDTRKEIVVAIRGSLSVIDVITDASIILTPFNSPGVTAPLGTRVHAGFLNGWNSVAIQVLNCVDLQLRTHPGYSLVTSGHSLGGSLASLAAISLKTNFPSSNITMYTYGQPRTGNSVYADWVNRELGENVFRVVHTFDGIPTIIPAGKLPFFRNQLAAYGAEEMHHGYRHHGIEYWQNPDPASVNTTRRCAHHGEDPDCSASIPSSGVNTAHFAYFGILAVRPFCTTEIGPSLPSDTDISAFRASEGLQGYYRRE